MTTFVLHDESVNTFGFRMLTSGADLTEFRKNPVMLLNHNDWSMPIGRWDNIRVDGGKILADAVFDEQDPAGQQAKSKVDRGFVRAASIGAWMPEVVDNSEVSKLPGQTGGTVTKWVVREASIVTIPANHNALAFYDRQTGSLVDMTDQKNLITLFDNHSNSNSNNNMKVIAGLLNLADTASEADVAAELQVVLSDRDRLKTENETLTGRIDELNKAAKQKLSDEAVALIDGAIRDGRIDAKAKESYIKLFDVDYEAAKTTLEAIPLRRSVSSQMEEGKTKDNAELADMQKLSWDEIDKQGKLIVLRDKYPDLYEQKFEQRFGVKPKK